MKKVIFLFAKIHYVVLLHYCLNVKYFVHLYKVAKKKLSMPLL